MTTPPSALALCVGHVATPRAPQREWSEMGSTPRSSRAICEEKPHAGPESAASLHPRVPKPSARIMPAQEEQVFGIKPP